MSRAVRLVLLAVTAVLVQTTLFPSFRIAGVVPDVGLVAVVAVAYREGPDTGAVMGFGTGLLLDLFLETPVGLSALAFALTGYLVGVVQGGLIRSARWVAPLLGALGGLVGGLLFVAVGTLAGREDLLAWRSLRVVLIAAAYDALISPVVFPVAGWAAREPQGAGGWRR